MVWVWYMTEFAVSHWNLFKWFNKKTNSSLKVKSVYPIWKKETWCILHFQSSCFRQHVYLFSWFCSSGNWAVIGLIAETQPNKEQLSKFPLAVSQIICDTIRQLYPLTCLKRAIDGTTTNLFTVFLKDQFVSIQKIFLFDLANSYL